MNETLNTGKIRLVRHSNEYWRVRFDLPPLNIFGPAHIPQLEEIVSLLETDERVKVVVLTVPSRGSSSHITISWRNSKIRQKGNCGDKAPGEYCESAIGFRDSA